MRWAVTCFGMLSGRRSAGQPGLDKDCAAMRSICIGKAYWWSLINSTE